MLFRKKGKNTIKTGVLLILLAILASGCNLQSINDMDKSAAETSAADGGTRALGPDLTVLYISHTYAQLVINQFETFTASIRNTGSTASAATSVTFQVGGNIQILSIPVLAPGSYCTFSRRVSFPTPGVYLITVKADTYNTVAESNESNNTKQITMHVYDYGRPDLFIRALTPSNSPEVGEYVHFDIQVMNHLQCGMSPPTKVQVRIGGETFGTIYSVPALAPGQGYNIGRGWIPSRAGNYRITAVADAENDAAEKDESNNVKYIDMSVSN